MDIIKIHNIWLRQYNGKNFAFGNNILTIENRLLAVNAGYAATTVEGDLCDKGIFDIALIADSENAEIY